MLAETLQTALKQFIDAAFAGSPPCTVFTGQDSRQQERPSAVCEVSTGDEFPEATGNHWLDCSVIVQSNANVDADGNATNAVHAALSKQIFDKVNTSTLAADINALGLQLTVIGIKERHVEAGIESDNFRSVFSFKAYAAPSVL